MKAISASCARRALRRRPALGLAIGLAVAGSLAVPAGAEAVYVGWSHLDDAGTHLEIRVDGTAAEVNDIRVTEHPTDPLILIREANEANSIFAQGGLCIPGGGTNAVQCFVWANGPNPRVTLRVTLRDGDDRYTGPPTRHVWTYAGQPIVKRAVVHGGKGDDVLRGGRWPSELHGGPGNDVLEAGDVGGNVLIGGTGFDVVRAGNGLPDQLIMCGGDGEAQSSAGRAVVDGLDPAPEQCSTVGEHITMAFTDAQAYTNDPVPSFSFQPRFGEPAADRECRVNGGAWSVSACNLSELSLADGAHAFEVRAKDIAGIWGPAAKHEWTVDTVPPEVTIGSGPGDGSGSVVGTTDASFEWTVVDTAPTTTECRRYAEGETPPAWQPCTSREAYSGLLDDDHVFELRATDAAGNQTIERYEWTVDTVPPELDFDGFGSRLITNDARPRLPSLSSASANFHRFECRADGEGPWRECAGAQPWPGPDLADGVRAIGVRAVSVAGVPTSPELEGVQEYLVDTVPPAVSFDSGQDPSGAEVVRGSYVEKGSGFASAQISVRPRNSHAEWRRLPTSEQSGRIWAPLGSLSPGLYEFRARVTDRAGNHGVSTKATDGTELVLNVSLRGTQISAGWPGRQSRRVTVRHGRRAQVAGRLQSAGGAPLGGQRVRILERFRAGSARRKQARTVRTDARGQFAAHLRPGPSREVLVSYSGSGRYAASAAGELTLGVRGAARLRAPKRVRAGKAVRFRGRVRCRGALQPARGKIVRLQVRMGRRWQTVRNPRRTKGDGRFRLRYRFGDFYTRPVRYRFRLRVPAEQGWPCRATRSNVRKLRVVPARRRG